MRRGGRTGRRKERVFFFEKKKQKTFGRCRGLVTSARQVIKVFWFFFSKKNILPFLGIDMTDLKYWVVDAFTQTLFCGNPAAVVLPDSALPDRLMQQIAAEQNLSETAFAVPEGDGYRLRWFTPTVEVDLCGHATLATSFVLRHLGHTGPYTYFTRSGVLTARAVESEIELDFPARSHEAIEVPAGLEAALGVAPVGVLRSADLIAVLASAEAVAGVKPDFLAIAKLPGGAVIVTAEGGEGVDITSRYFAPAYGIDEDPVTGALHTQVVPYWAKRLGRETLLCHQASARGGFMTCVFAAERVKMRGSAVLVASGKLHLP
jgi:PhzF family phenazine biosynthesis protein